MPRTGFEKSKVASQRSNTSTSTKKKSYRQRSIDAPTFDTCSPQVIHALVCLCTTYGASPTFSYTRDGTSLVIAVYYENERYVDYLSGNDDLVEYLRWVSSDLLGCSDTDLSPYAFILTEKA